MADERQLYQIRIEGQLDRHWDEWFTGMSLTYQCCDGVHVSRLQGQRHHLL